MISYDYPLNERVRTLLRLEDLFAKSEFFASQSQALDHHAALLSLFEILEVSCRADLKSAPAAGTARLYEDARQSSEAA